MALAALPVGKVVEGAARGLTNDLVVLNGQVFRRVVVQKARRKSKRYPHGQEEIVQLTPINLEAHINPLSLGVGAAAVALVAGALVARVRVNVPLGEPLEVYTGPFADEFDAWKARFFADRATDKVNKLIEERKRECARLGGTWDQAQNVCVLPQDPVDVGSGVTCAQLHDAFVAFRDGGDAGSAFKVKEAARVKGCAWAQ